MPVVPTYQPGQVRQGVAQTPDATPAEFGSGNAWQIQQAGQAGLAAGGDLISAATQQQEIVNRAQVRDTLSQAQNETLDYVTDNVLAKKGKDAIGILPQAQSDLKTLQNRYADSLQSPAQKRMFNQLYPEVYNHASEMARRHILDQTLAYNQQTLVASKSAAVNAAMADQIKLELAKTATGESSKLPERIATMRSTLMAPKLNGGAGYSAEEADSQIAVLMAGLKNIAAKRGESVDDTVNRLGLGLKMGDIEHSPEGLTIRNQGIPYEHDSAAIAENNRLLEERARAGDPEAGADLLKGLYGADTEKLSDFSTRTDQAQRYQEIAEKTGKVLSPQFLEGAKEIGIGGEHVVYLKGDRVFKVTQDHEDFAFGTGTALDYQTTPHQYLKRFALSNKIFGDDIKWEGVMPGNGGHLRTVTSQSFLKGEKPTQAEINAKMREGGFQYHEIPGALYGQAPDKLWYRPHDNVLVGDVKPENFVKSADGKVHSVDVIAEHATQAQRDKLGVKSQDARGAVSFADGRTLIHLFATSDFSTVLHESGHLFLHEMQSLVDQGIADEGTRADLETLREFSGIKPGEKLTTEGEEKIVRAFESYLREGKAPSVGLAGAFAQFRTWLTSIYRSATALGTQPTDSVRQVFDRMLASEEDIHEAQEYYSRTGDILNLIQADVKDKEEVRAKLISARANEIDRQTSAYVLMLHVPVRAVRALKEGGHIPFCTKCTKEASLNLSETVSFRGELA